MTLYLQRMTGSTLETRSLRHLGYAEIPIKEQWTPEMTAILKAKDLRAQLAELDKSIQAGLAHTRPEVSGTKRSLAAMREERMKTNT